jgi:hypothetical protein
MDTLVKELKELSDILDGKSQSKMDAIRFLRKVEQIEAAVRTNEQELMRLSEKFGVRWGLRYRIWPHMEWTSKCRESLREVELIQETLKTTNSTQKWTWVQQMGKEVVGPGRDDIELDALLVRDLPGLGREIEGCMLRECNESEQMG